MWIAEDLLNYPIGNIVGQAGGTGWAGAWQSNSPTTQWQVVSSPTSPLGGVVENISHAPTGNDVERYVTPTNIGTVYVSIMCDGTSTGDVGVTLLEGLTSRMIFFFNRIVGNLAINDGTTYVSVVNGFVPNQWYRVGFDWDFVNHPNQWRWSVNNGPWSAYVGINPANPSGNTLIDNIDLNYDSTTTGGYWAGISPNYTPTGGGTSVTPSYTSSVFSPFIATISSATTINIPLGTPSDGQMMVIRLSSAGGTQSITWNPSYRGTLPTSITGNITYCLFIYNASRGTWDLLESPVI